MHNKHIFIVQADNAELAISQVKTELELDESLTSNNWFTVCGAVDTVSGAYTLNDDYRDCDELKTIEGINKEISEYISKERYDKLKEQLQECVDKHQWHMAGYYANQLDGIEVATHTGFDLKKNIVGINEFDKFSFGVTIWTENNNDLSLFAVIVDFHS